MSNVYYHPEDFGLEIFEEINDDNASYSFDDFVIWRRKEDGRLLFASDSGCSCPAPFEDVSVSDLQLITDVGQLEIAIDSYNGPFQWCTPRCTSERKQEVLRKVKAYLTGEKK